MFGGNDREGTAARWPSGCALTKIALGSFLNRTLSAPHFAFWTFDDGFGIANTEQCQVYDNLSGLLLQRRDSARSAEHDAEDLLNGKALEHVLLDQYLGSSQ